MVDQLLENIDVTYSKSDDVGDSEEVKDEESFHKNYLKNSKSKTNANDDPIILAYYIVGSDKLLSDIEVPIQNVIAEKIDKVFKPVEIEKSEIDKFAGIASKKTFYNKPSYKKKNTKDGLGYKKNQKKRAEKTRFQKKTNFVHGRSSEEVKEI
ncbi:hypothetical protein Hanom_Chr17g01581891 [Helianthus anomalus]